MSGTKSLVVNLLEVEPDKFHLQLVSVVHSRRGVLFDNNIPQSVSTSLYYIGPVFKYYGAVVLGFIYLLRCQYK